MSAETNAGSDTSMGTPTMGARAPEIGSDREVTTLSRGSFLLRGLTGHAVLVAIGASVVAIYLGVNDLRFYSLLFGNLAPALLTAPLVYRAIAKWQMPWFSKLAIFVVASSLLSAYATNAFLGIGENISSSPRFYTPTTDLFAICFGINAAAYMGPALLIPRVPASAITHKLSRYFLFLASTITSENPFPEMAKLLLRPSQFSEFVATMPLERVAVVEDLRTRGYKLRAANSLLLVFVVVVLICAAAFVVFAGQIAGKDTQSLDSLLALRESIDSQEQALRRLEDDRISLESQLRKATAPNAKGKSDTEEPTVTSSRLEVLEARRVRLYKELERSRELYAEAQKANVVRNPNDERSTTTLLIAAGITRFGVLAITIYLVQILLGLYRYNAQVAAHYFTQADALLLMGHSATELGDLTSRLHLAVGFGKVETSLPEKALDRIGEVLKQAIERQGKPAA